MLQVSAVQYARPRGGGRAARLATCATSASLKSGLQREAGSRRESLEVSSGQEKAVGGDLSFCLAGLRGEGDQEQEVSAELGKRLL